MSSTTSTELRPLDSEKLGHMKSVIVRAGAGAGKTTELVDRVLSIARNFHFQNKKWPRLVVTTFTRKATHELRQRLMERALELNEPALVDFVRRRSLVHISTIHGVLSLFLSRYGVRMGLAPEYQLVGTLDESKSLRRSLRRLIQKDSQAAESFVFLLQNMGLSQLEKELKNFFELSLQHPDLKTPSPEEIQQRIQREFQQILKKSQELCQSLVGTDLPESWQGFATALSRTIQLGTKQAFLDFAQNTVSPRASKKIDPHLSDFKNEVLEKIESLSEFHLSDDFVEIYQQFSKNFLLLFAQWYPTWIQEKIQSSQLTMNDLEILSLYLIRAQPQSAIDFSAEWDYWLIDEYQDTSPRQVNLLKQLIGKKNSFIVGDPQQSIYLFRGARSEVFNEREEELKNSGGELIPKMENYRSRPELLEFFNDFFSHLSTQFQPMLPKNNQGRPVDPENPVAIFYNKDFDLRQEKQAAEDFETAAVLARIHELLQKNISPEQICVLGRANKELRRFSQAVINCGIPVQIHSSSQFFERREIRDALAYLKFIINPHDSSNCIELLRSPWAKLSDKEIALIAKGSGLSFWDSARKSESHSTLDRLKKILLSAQELGIGTAWVEALKDSGLIDFSRKIDPSGRREANLWKLIWNLRSLEKKPGFNYLEFIEKLDQLELDPESGDGDAVPVIEPRRVNFMTVHASKGLQFEHVILSRMGSYRSQVKTPFLLSDEKQGYYVFSPPNPDDSKWTAPLQGQELLENLKQREQQEYDRLLYVALTRAKHSVTLVWTGKDKSSWAYRMMKPMEVGLQAGQKYQIELRDQVLQVDFLKLASSERIPVRSKWESKEFVSPKMLSVTQFLNQLPLTTSHQPAALAEDIFSLTQKAQSGVEAHRVFEALKYGGINSKNPEILKALDFLKSWEQGLILELIQSGHPEWGFTFQYKNKIIQGQIDLWGLDKKKNLWILDYKTGSQAYKQKAFTQLQIYSYALKTIRPELKELPTKLAVVYPMHQQVYLESGKPLVQLESEFLKD